MALRNQPYLPLYVDDFTSDEDLRNCSAESTGVYILLLCAMHKSKEYGTIFLKNKEKVTKDFLENISLKLARQMPFETSIIKRALIELLEEDVIQKSGNKISQKRMVKDNDISEKRSNAGKKGNLKRHHFSEEFAIAKTVADTGYVIGIENVNVNSIFKEYIQIRIDNNYSLNQKIVDRLVNELMELSTNEKEQIKIVSQAINGEWKNFYPPNKKEIKENKPKQKASEKTWD